MDAREIGNEIQKLRKLKGLTQEDLAFKTGVSTRTIQRIESGEVDARSYTLNLLAKALEVSPDHFASDDDAIDQSANQATKWVAFLHLSGILILLLPPLIVYMVKRNEVEELEDHWPDVINFQLSMWLYFIVLSIPPILFVGIFILPFLGIYCTIIVVVNTVRAMNRSHYNYPLSIQFVKRRVAMA